MLSKTRLSMQKMPANNSLLYLPFLAAGTSHFPSQAGFLLYILFFVPV
jgi:hypothetical protein